MSFRDNTRKIRRFFIILPRIWVRKTDRKNVDRTYFARLDLISFTVPTTLNYRVVRSKFPADEFSILH